MNTTILVMFSFLHGAGPVAPPAPPQPLTDAERIWTEQTRGRTWTEPTRGRTWTEPTRGRTWTVT